MKKSLLLCTLSFVIFYACSVKKSTIDQIPAEDSTTVIVETVSPEIPLELQQGKKLYDNSCGKCHKLYEPKDYTAESWKPIVARMQKKARLDDNEITLVYNYLVSELN